MTQAQGIVPRPEGHVIKNPEATGYLIGVRLRRDIGRDRLRAWLEAATAAVRQLIEPDPDRGDEADVATGLAPSLFGVGDATTIEPPLQRPAGFEMPLPRVEGALMGVDVVFYVMSLSEARVARFVEAIWGPPNDRVVERIDIERGYQRIDRTEAFGYADGLRNVRSSERYRIVYVHRDELFEEPDGAEGGSYLVYMKIRQNLDAFRQLPPDEQDAIMGRRRDGTRVDDSGVVARAEIGMPDAEPPRVTSHVRKAGPRGAHDDVQIFRRGLPYVETVPDGTLHAGLHFVSFQASLDQFDVMFNDWMMNDAFPQSTFPVASVGRDALLDDRFTTFERSGIFFCPPHDEVRHIGATLFDTPAQPRRPQTGRVAIRKRLVNESDANQRFERGRVPVRNPGGGRATGRRRDDDGLEGARPLRRTPNGPSLYTAGVPAHAPERDRIGPDRLHARER